MKLLCKGPDPAPLDGLGAGDGDTKGEGWEQGKFPHFQKQYRSKHNAQFLPGSHVVSFNAVILLKMSSGEIQRPSEWTYSCVETVENVQRPSRNIQIHVTNIM